WGNGFIMDAYDPDYSVQVDYEFGPGFYGAIKPLFIIGMITTILLTMFLSPPAKEKTFITKNNFLFVRIVRLIYTGGAICAFSAFMLFAKFINQLNQLISIYQFNFIFYICAITYGLAMVLGLLGTITEIEVVLSKKDKQKKYQEAKQHIAMEYETVDGQTQITKSEVIDSPQISHQEKIDKIKAVVIGKKDTNINWVETVTLISKEEIAEIVTTDLGLVVVNGRILTPEEAEKQASRN
ncbi:MAG: hypothetical protein ACTSWD_11910, partial [Candidatus Heimdallarchaeota archaeon]